MKREAFKRNSKQPKPRVKPREVLSELHFNIADHRQGKTSRQPRLFDKMPEALLIEILSYLPAKDLLHSVQLLSKEWHVLCGEPVLWQWLESKGLSFKHRVKHLKCLVERRSKGKIFTGLLRSSLVPITVRKVMLDVTNAGFDDGVPTSLLREISYLSEISHPGIVPLLGAELLGKSIFILHEQSEFNLKDYMRKFGHADSYKMPVSTIKHLMTQLLRTLCFLHKKRFMHRNLKPDNLLVSKDGELKIADFTMSKLTSTPHVQYTPEDPKERDRSGREARRLWYRAPELLLRKEMYAFEVDMWTAGCILAELALGHPLFNGENEIEQLFKVFRFTGVPESVPQARSFPSWKPVCFADIFASKDSEAYHSFMEALLPTRAVIFKLLTKLGHILGPDGMDLLQRMLEVDSSGRITASEALEHPFIAGGEESPVHDVLEQYYVWEVENRCKEDYLARQPSLTSTMRSILVDWLIDVSVHFEVTDDTLHIAIGLIDRVLEKMEVDRSKLQLVGVTCMKIADVLNERSKEYYRQENSIEYSYITADEYTPAEVVQMEKQILNLLHFKVITPNILTFSKVYRDKLEIDEETWLISAYLADLMLLCYEAAQFRPSLIASVVLYLACCCTSRFPDLSKVTIETKYTETEFKNTVDFVKEVWLDARSSPFFTRYESINHKFYAISPFNIWPPATNNHPWI